MDVVSERLSHNRFIPKWVRNEHLARYAFAARFTKGKTVVDCACGDGIGTAAFLEAGAAVVEGFDQSAAAISAARARCPSANVRVRLSQAHALPLAAHMADVYISLETIEHLSEDEAFLTEVVRVLKPEGVLICSTPNRRVTNPGTSISDSPWNRFHVREYSMEEFTQILGARFGQVELYGQNPTPHIQAGAMEIAARILPRHGAVRLNQLLKLPALMYDTVDRHAVQALSARYSYEYLVAVCRRPRWTASGRVGDKGVG